MSRGRGRDWVHRAGVAIPGQKQAASSWPVRASCSIFRSSACWLTSQPQLETGQDSHLHHGIGKCCKPRPVPVPPLPTPESQLLNIYWPITNCRSSTQRTFFHSLPSSMGNNLAFQFAEPLGALWAALSSPLCRPQRAPWSHLGSLPGQGGFPHQWRHIGLSI